MKYTDIDFSTIDWNLNNAGEWSTPIKTMVIAFISLFIFSLGIFYDTLSLIQTLESAEKKKLILKHALNSNTINPLISLNTKSNLN
jgi:Tfp pilus assembly protein PilO